MKHMSHNIIIRMAYEPDDSRFAWRFAFFQAMCLPRLFRQTDQDFEIWVRCHPEHNDLIGGLHPKVHPFQGYGIEDGYMGFPMNNPHSERALLPRSHIQTRMDCDDLVSKHFVARIHKEVAKQPDKPLLVSFQPWKLDLYTLTRYYMARRYHGRCTSMFLSLYQPDIEGSNYWHIYNYNHCRIWQELGESIKVVTVREGYCDLVVHDDNRLTTIKKEDIPLEPKEPEKKKKDQENESRSPSVPPVDRMIKNPPEQRCN
jgi:hypothetical protein